MRELISAATVITSYSIHYTKLYEDAALTWLQEQGAQRVWGPMNGSIWTPHRFKLSHFDERTFATEPYNKSYYPSYFERYGFELKEKWFSRRMDRSVLVITSYSIHYTKLYDCRGADRNPKNYCR